MPKMKTNRGAAKRFKATGGGRIRRSKAFSSHILTKKSTKRKRNLRKTTLINAVDARAVRRMLPYL
ncbi:MAG: 50S ribosomal protein L35 [Desulfobulbaceae bacterium]|jgi:large subunit ribosomal protein L35|nr:50S ribosomal protein L35 [Desulfobulbaceae bacterium]